MPDPDRRLEADDQIALSFAVSIPVGAWHDSLPRTFDSLTSPGAPLKIALLDASGDSRVARAADASGLTFAHRSHAPDAGQSAAIMEGWARTRSDIVFWLNADDHLAPGALKTVSAAFAADSHADVVYGGSDFVGPSEIPIGVHDQIADVSAYLFRSNIISQPSCFVRRAAIERVGGLNTQLEYVMDWDLWVRLYAAGARFVRLEQTLSSVFMGEGTKTARLAPRRLAEVFALVRRHAGLWAACKSTLAVAAATRSACRKWA